VVAVGPSLIPVTVLEGLFKLAKGNEKLESIFK